MGSKEGTRMRKVALGNPIARNVGFLRSMEAETRVRYTSDKQSTEGYHNDSTRCGMHLPQPDCAHSLLSVHIYMIFVRYFQYEG